MSHAAGSGASAVSTLTIRTSGGDLPGALAVPPGEAGGRALVRIEQFKPGNGGQND
jgi:hypothetical protein